MTDVSKILSSCFEGDPTAASQLLPIIYEDLRNLAARHMAGQPAGHSLQATALVHEAYVRLIELEPEREWEGRRHFFAAAAEAMRRILVDRARRKLREKHGGNLARQRFSEDSIVTAPVADLQADLLALDSALGGLEQEKPRMAELVKLRFFVGMSHRESAEMLGISKATADRDWAYARAWLIGRMGSS